MSSLTSSAPKPQAQPAQIVYYTPTPATPAPQSQPETPTPEPTQTPEQKAEQERTTNLLERKRGTTGTIHTSFRGLLSTFDKPAGKSLLGQ